jgi:hypothetical protein
VALSDERKPTLTTAEFAELLRIAEGMGRRLGLSWDVSVDAATEVVMRTLNRTERLSSVGFMAVCIWHELIRVRRTIDGLPRLPGAQKRRKKRGAA